MVTSSGIQAGSDKRHWPLVSCVVPTRDRRYFIPLAIRSYEKQTYPNKELVILDNGDDGTADLIPQRPDIRYYQVKGPKTTGEMRNLCGEIAHGSYICHFDSDDWSAPDRLMDQMDFMRGIDLVGYSTMWFYDCTADQVYYWNKRTTDFALGTSLCYTKAWWTINPFHHIAIGEDYAFVMKGLRSGVFKAQPVMKHMVALVHSRSTSPKMVSQMPYHKDLKSNLPEEFFRDYNLTIR